MSKGKNTDYQLYAEASEDAEASVLRKSIAATKLLENYQGQILTELLLVFVDYKKDLTKEIIEFIKNQLGNISVNDFTIVPDNIFPLLKDIVVVGQNIIKSFNDKNPNFFEVEHNQSVTKYNSIASFVLDVLKEGLITNLEKVEKEFNEYNVERTLKLQDQKVEKKDQTSTSSNQKEKSLGRSITDTGGDSPLRNQEQADEVMSCLKDTFFLLTPEDCYDVLTLLEKSNPDVKRKMVESVKLQKSKRPSVTTNVSSFSKVQGTETLLKTV